MGVETERVEVLVLVLVLVLVFVFATGLADEDDEVAVLEMAREEEFGTGKTEKVAESSGMTSRLGTTNGPSDDIASSRRGSRGARARDSLLCEILLLF